MISHQNIKTSLMMTERINKTLTDLSTMIDYQDVGYSTSEIRQKEEEIINLVENLNLMFGNDQYG